MKLPVWLLRLLPMWEHICPACRRKVAKNSHECSWCGEKYPFSLRVPPRLYKDQKALEDYVHKHVFPKVSRAYRDYLTMFFTELFSSGWEDSGGSDITDNGSWDSYETSGATLSVSALDSHHGSYCLRVSGTAIVGNNDVLKNLGSDYDTLYVRFYVNFQQLPAAGQDLIILSVFDEPNSASTGQAYFNYENSGGTLRWKIRYRDSSAWYSSVYEQTLDAETWHCVEAKHVVGGGDGEDRLYVDGVERITVTGIDNDDRGTTADSIGIPLLYSSGSVDILFDCVVVADAYIGPEGSGLVEVADSLGLSDFILRHKPSVAVSDGVGVSDGLLGNKNMLVADAVSLSGFVEVITGAIIKTVADIVNVADLVPVNKSVVIADTVAVLDAIFRHRPAVSVLDVVSVAEAVLVSKLLSVLDSMNLVDVLRVLKTLNVSDALSLLDSASTPSRVIQALDTIGVTDYSIINKTLRVSETVSLTEIIQAGVGNVKKTRLFLILGDLAIQLTGD